MHETNNPGHWLSQVAFQVVNVIGGMMSTVASGHEEVQWTWHGNVADTGN